MNGILDECRNCMAQYFGTGVVDCSGSNWRFVSERGRLARWVVMGLKPLMGVMSSSSIKNR